MLVLIDTGVLLRFDQRSGPTNLAARQALRDLRGRGHSLVTASQSIAEFWNVCTRPATARGGFGLSMAATDRKLRLIERLVQVLPDSPLAYPHWKRLVKDRGVMGVQVHDARLVAQMISYSITHIVTFNTRDFVRFSEVQAIDPSQAAAI